MLLKRRSYIGEKNNIEYMNGIASIGSVKLNVYSFAIDGVLIDTGSASLFSEFKHFFDSVNIDKVVITHHHEDHTGGAAYIQNKYHLPILMNEKMIESCKRRATYPFYRRIFWGSRKPFVAKPIGDTFQSRSASWKVIETPGHAADHVAFINEKTGQLFSGDLYVHPETKLVLRDESIPQIIASIERLLTYDFEEMFCCHAGFVKDGRKALKTKLDYLTNLRDEVLHLANKGLSEKEIHRKIFPKNYPIVYLSFGEWHSKHIIYSILQN